VVRNPMARRFIRRWPGRFFRLSHGVLAVVVSVAVAAGLVAATAPARASTAAVPGSITLTFDPGPDPAYPSTEADIQNEINYINGIGAGTLGQDLERLNEETVPTLPSGSQPVSPIPDFHGTLSATPDGGGISMTIPSDEAAVYSDSQWWQILAGLAYAATWIFVRVACTIAFNFIPFIGPITAQVICAPLAGVAANAARTAVMDKVKGMLGNGDQWAAAMVSGLISSLPSGAWEAGIGDLAKGFPPKGSPLPPPPTPSPNPSVESFGLTRLFAEEGDWFPNSSNFSGLSSVLTATDTSNLQSVGSFFRELADDLPAAADSATPPTSPTGHGTCDAYTFYKTPCAGAYSTTHALSSMYDGPLYQVKRTSDGTTKKIGVVSPGGDADAAAQKSFCAGTTCTITELYDQSPGINDLAIEGSGGAGGQDKGAPAGALPVTVGSNQDQVFGLDIEPGTGYRDNTTQYIAKNGAPEGMYMVASGTHVNSKCCFDFGNVENDGKDHGAGHMDAVNLGTFCGGNNKSGCVGEGPWVEADLENGQWQGGNGSNSANTGLTGVNFATAMLNNNGKDNFELEGGNGQSGGLTTYWDGNLPPGYTMDQEGGIVLGTGGDNSNEDVGSFFEGAMTVGYPTAAADAAVQRDIVAADYKGNSGPAPGANAAHAVPSAAGAAVVHKAGATGKGAAGFSSVYTVDSANGHLQESYLPSIGANWTTQDLSSTGGAGLPGTPQVMPGTTPVAIVHCGFTSVFTVDAGSGDLQETYLPQIGGGWTTQDLSQKYGTPPTDVTPTAVVHAAGATGASAACGFTSVYTIDRGSNDLQETYLPLIGQPWLTQDLSDTGGAGLPGTPPAQPGTSPVAIVHCGFTSVFTVDASHQLQETYLQHLGGGGWTTQNLSVKYGTPDTVTTPTAVVHGAGATGAAAACGFTSVYTVNQSNNTLEETYLPLIGDNWNTQPLPAPPVAPGTAPTALVHMGFTSVYTVDQGNYHLQETYLPKIGDGWNTQDLSDTGGAGLPGTPPTTQTPIVLLHPDANGKLDWTSVFTINQATNHLEETYLPNVGFPGDAWTTQDLSAKYGIPPAAATDTPTANWAVVHDGVTSVYTVAANGHLDETYQPAIGGSWNTQDLSSTGGAGLPGTPPVMLNTQPVALVHDGVTSVYTIDTHGDLQETYLQKLGGAWTTQDLTKEYNVPKSAVTPAAVFHDGFVSVYTVDASNDDLQETYLQKLGGGWNTQDLSDTGGAGLPGTPKVDDGTSPSVVFNDGYVRVFTTTQPQGTGTGSSLQETYLPKLGGSWHTQSLAGVAGPEAGTSPSAVVNNGYVSVFFVDGVVPVGQLVDFYLPAVGGTWSFQVLPGPPSALFMSPVALYHAGFTSVYYANENGGLQETYLPAIGGSWNTQDLSSTGGAGLPGTPVVEPLTKPAPLLHYDASGGLTWTSVYTINARDGHLQETYLPRVGDAWTTQDLTNKYHTPPGADPYPPSIYSDTAP
jgi:hypothetical protein